MVYAAAAIGVYLLVAGLIVFSALAYRRRRLGERGASFNNNPPLEIAWTVIPLLIVGALFWVSYRVEYPVDAITLRPDEVIDVTAFRWGWRFDYPREHVTIQGDVGKPPVLVLPLHQTVEIALTSSDVVHELWVPAFLFKREAIPGRVNRFDWTADKLGRFSGHCSEFCGVDHAFMLFSVQVVPADQFRAALRRAS